MSKRLMVSKAASELEFLPNLVFFLETRPVDFSSFLIFFLEIRPVDFSSFLT